MSNVTSLTDLAGDDVVQELLTRIKQLEAQDGAGYEPCLKFYKRLATQCVDSREAFRAGMAARDSGAEFDEANDWFDAYVEDEADRA